MVAIYIDGNSLGNSLDGNRLSLESRPDVMMMSQISWIHLTITKGQ